jgi:flagellar hook-basal body complex protein FliE
MPIDPVSSALSSAAAAGLGRATTPGALARPGADATTTAASGGSGAAGASFGDRLRDVLGTVDGSTADANAAIGRMLDGTGDVHEAVIALQRADTMLQLTVQIRNKIVQAYQDVMRMPI